MVEKVWSIPYVFVAFFLSLKQPFIADRSSKLSWRPECIFENPYLWQSGFSRVYSNSYCSCSFESEIIKVGQSSDKIISNNILNFQESTTILKTHTKKIWKLIVCTPYIYILNACTKKVWILLNVPHTHTHTHTLIYIYIYIHIIYIYIWALLLRVHIWNSSFLRNNLLRVQCTCCIYIYIYIYIASFCLKINFEQKSRIIFRQT